VSKSWAEMKASVVITTTKRVGHVQGWCIGALINVSKVEQPRDFISSIGKGHNTWLVW
jgi:hypothetical protein